MDSFAIKFIRHFFEVNIRFCIKCIWTKDYSIYLFSERWYSSVVVRLFVTLEKPFNYTFTYLFVSCQPSACFTVELAEVDNKKTKILADFPINNSLSRETIKKVDKCFHFSSTFIVNKVNCYEETIRRITKANPASTRLLQPLFTRKVIMTKKKMQDICKLLSQHSCMPQSP